MQLGFGKIGSDWIILILIEANIMDLAAFKIQSSLPHFLYTAQQIKEMEGPAALLAGVSLMQLMQRRR